MLTPKGWNMKNLLPALLAGSMLLCGCGRTPRRDLVPVALPPHPAENAVTLRRTEQLRKFLAPMKVRAAVFFPTAFFPHAVTADAEVLTSLKKCGFNRVYCHITSEQELDDRLRAFLAAAAQAGLPVEIAISQIDFYRRYRANQLIRWALIQYPDLFRAAELVTEFNQSLPKEHRIAGITVYVAPHIYNGQNVWRMYNQLYRWADTRYGKGGDNDMLMREALDILRRIAAIPDLPPLTVAFPDFYHDRAVAGDLSVGAVKDFAAISPSLMIINTANLPSQMARNLEKELNDAPPAARIIAEVPLAHHSSISTGRLRRRNWDDFMRALEAFKTVSAKDDNFDGMALSPLAVIEYLRQEK